MTSAPATDRALPAKTILYVRRGIENYRAGRWFCSSAADSEGGGR